jgi:hypothetical protein
MERKNKARAETGIYLVIVAVILVVANIVSLRVSKRFDATKNERFSLSKGSAHLVSEKLTKPLEITLYVTRGLPKFEVFIQDLTDLLNAYEKASNGKLHYTIIEPKTEDERKQAREDEIQEAPFGEVSKTGHDKALISKGFMGMSFKYGTEKDKIPMLHPDQAQGIEFWISNKIREIHDRADNDQHEIGVLINKDELKISDANLVAGGGRGQGPNIKAIMEQLFPFYKFKDVDLQAGEAEIDKNLSGVLITQPGKDFTEKELRRIDQFLMLGNKSVAIMASAVNLKDHDATMKAELNTRGLDKLLDGYGVEMKKDAILDYRRPATLQLQAQGVVIGMLQYPGAVVAQYYDRADESTQFLDQNFPGFFRMEEIIFPAASTLVAHPDKQPGVSVKVVARSSPAATSTTTDTVELRPSRELLTPHGEFAQRALAIAVEGKIKSAFAGKADAAVPAPEEAKDKSRLLVISSSAFLANPIARAGNAPQMPPQMMMMGNVGGDEELQMISQPYAQTYLTNTILAFKNTLDWMSFDSDLLAASAKLAGDPSLTYLGVDKPKNPPTDADSAKKLADEYDAQIQSVQQKVQLTMTVFPAALFALLGLVLWRVRESKRASFTID